VIRSASANAENNFNLDVDELIVLRAYADEARTLKRYRPRARGRANQILKRSSHVTVVVSEREA
jgi:large subunit ribosomal protein L22